MLRGARARLLTLTVRSKDVESFWVFSGKALLVFVCCYILILLDFPYKIALTEVMVVKGLAPRTLVSTFIQLMAKTF